MDKAYWSYSTIESEALAAVAAIKEFLPYTVPSWAPPYLDYRSQLSNLPQGTARCKRLPGTEVIILQQFDFTVQYCPGSCNNVVHALSRRPPFPTQVMASIQSTLSSLEDQSAIKKAQEDDPIIRQMIDTMNKNTPLRPPFNCQANHLFLLEPLLCQYFR